MNGAWQQLTGYFQHYGYWTVAAALLLENAGIPVPGETVLVAASVFATSHETLRLPMIILVGTVAASLGDNLGYALGRWGGRRLLTRYSRVFRVSAASLARGERLFARLGSAAVYFARFVFGLRVLAGPLAGVLVMPWPRFLLFNVLGAASWVTVVATLGYTFGHRVAALLASMRTASLVLLAVGVLALVIGWKRIAGGWGEDGA
jgi:membrane protein DedA with SNARE-associated domain